MFKRGIGFLLANIIVGSFFVQVATIAAACLIFIGFFAGIVCAYAELMKMIDQKRRVLPASLQLLTLSRGFKTVGG